jgi:integrase
MAATPRLHMRRRGNKAGDAAAIWYILCPRPGGDGRRKKFIPTKFRGPAEEGKAKKLLAEFIRLREAKVALEGAADVGPLTVRRWCGRWLEGRTKKGVDITPYRSYADNHVLPVIGDMRLDTVKVEHIEQVMDAMADKGLAPKTRLNVYRAMHAMFRRALKAKLLEHSPVEMDDEDLPARIDADPEWRATAVFTRAEVGQIISDERIPFDRRVFYAISFLAGPRFGEVSGLHVRHYDPHRRPLGSLLVALSFNSKTKQLKETKAKKPRLVPVHPVLARILGDWLAWGFEEWMGRPPRADDPLVPGRWWKTRQKPSRPPPAALGHRRGPNMYERFQADLKRIGLRGRRQHDDRRTFISLAREDLASKDLIRLVTHGPEGDIIDVYSEISWPSLCAEVAKLRVELPPGPGSEDALFVARKSAKPLAGGLPMSCQGEIPNAVREVTSWAQQGSNLRPTD